MFLSTESIRIVTDLFWWFFLDYPQNEVNADAANKEKLFNRVALNFGMLIIRIPDKQVHNFLPCYPETVAMTLYWIFNEAFAGSRKLFGPDFKQKLINICHLWMEGLQPLPNSFHKWPVEKLEIRKENSLGWQSTDPQKSALFQDQPTEIVFQYSKVRFDPNGCSPLIHKFLQLHGFEPNRSGASRCLQRLQNNGIPGDTVTCAQQLEHYRQQKEHRRLTHNEACLENERQSQEMLRQRFELEKRFEHLQREIDNSGSVLDMRILLQDFVEL